MTLVFHHFRKDFRWVWPRWVLFLAVLAFDFAYNLEWIYPLRPSHVYGISEVMGGVLWLVAWWVALSTPPEDAAEGGRGFGWTRPLPRRSYWLARLLVWALLIVLPLMLEVGGYLLLMQRPWNEIGLGMLEQLFTAGAMTLWVLPAALVFRGWERYVALVIFAALWEVGYARTLLELVIKLFGTNVRYLNYPFMEPMRFVGAAWVVAPLMVVLLAWHQRRGLGLMTRYAALSAMTLLTYALAVSPLSQAWSAREQEPDLAARLQTVVQPLVGKEGLQFFPRTDDEHGRHIAWTAAVAAEGTPHGLIPMWIAEETTVTQQGRTLPMLPGGPMNRVDPWLVNLLLHQPFAHALPGSWPADSLTADSYNQPSLLAVPNLPQPVDMDTPVDISLNLAALWTRLRELGHAPLRAGARIQAPEAELEVLEVMTNVDSRGRSSPGAVSLLLRQSMRTLSSGPVWWPVPPVVALHAPGRRLLWQRTVTSGSDWRSLRLGWVHTVTEVSFSEVMVPGTGVTEENLGAQQVLWLKPDYLGASRHRVEIKGADMGAQARRPGHGPSTEAAVTRWRDPRQEFLAAVRETPRPAVEAPLPEAAHYVAAVYAASAAHQRRTETNSFAEPVWPGDDHEAAALLAPYLIQHPGLVRRLRFEKPGGLTDMALREALRQARIPGLPNEAAEELWPPEVDTKQVLDAVSQMLQTRSDAPLAALLRPQPESLERKWQEFPAKVGIADLRILYHAAGYRDKAVAEVERQYAALQASTALGESGAHILRVIAAKAVLGDGVALDRLLRIAALQDEEHSGHLRSLQAAHRAAFASAITLREVPDFIRQCRAWTQDDFRYDAATMAWVLKPGAESKPPLKP